MKSEGFPKVNQSAGEENNNLTWFNEFMTEVNHVWR